MPAVPSAELDGNALLKADDNPNDWPMYHQSYNSWYYSDLDQINSNNVKDLKIAWIHTPNAGKRGVQSFPLVVDGVLYDSTSGSQVWALDGATGAVKWNFKPKLDEERLEGTIFNSYNRGVAAVCGNIYVGTADGRLLAISRVSGGRDGRAIAA